MLESDRFLFLTATISVFGRVSKVASTATVNSLLATPVMAQPESDSIKEGRPHGQCYWFIFYENEL